MASTKAKLPETLPEFPAVDTPSEFSALDHIEEKTAPGVDDSSGVQPVGQAWTDVYAQLQSAFASADYDRALLLAERYLQHDEKDLFARLCVEECRLMLEAKLTELLEPLDRVVVLRLTFDQIARARIDHRSAFLLSRVDGASSIEDLLDIAGMPRLDALRYIADWVQQGYVALH